MSEPVTTVGDAPAVAVEAVPPEMLEIIPPDPDEAAVTGAKFASIVERTVRGSVFGAHKRSKWQREVDLLEVADMMCRRVGTAIDIARQLNAQLTARGAGYTLSAEQIRYDMRDIERRWQEQFIGGTMRQRKAAELAFLDRIEREAWEVYERTKRDEQKGMQTTEGTAATGDAGGMGRALTVSKTVMKSQRDGEIGPLLLLVKISERRAKLLGMDSPVKIEVEEDDKNKETRLAAIQQAFRQKIERELRSKGIVIPVETIPAPPLPKTSA